MTATSDLYVSNFGQGNSAWREIPRKPHAQVFTAGSNAGGYILKTIELRSEDPQNDDFSVALWSTEGSDDHPSSRLFSLTPPDSYAAGRLVFTAPANRVLAQNTKYAVVIDRIGSGAPRLSTTKSGGEDAGAGAGWSIEDHFDFLDAANIWADGQGLTESYRIAVRAVLRSSMQGQNSPGNDPPTGGPAINGTAQVGETLTADTASIADADGLDDATFAYQWLNGGVAIEGATGQSYTVVAGDAGARLYVRVSFTDDGGNEETLTSEPTETVVFPPLTLESATVDGADLKLTYSHPLNATTELLETAFTVTVNEVPVKVSDASVSGSEVSIVLASAVEEAVTVRVSYQKPETDNRNHVIIDAMGRPAQNFSGRPATNNTPPPPLTARASGAPATHDGSASFTFQLHFSEEPSIGYRTLRDDAFTESGGEVVNARRLTAGSSLGWEITVEPSGNGTVTLTLPAATDCTATGAICTSGR